MRRTGRIWLWALLLALLLTGCGHASAAASEASSAGPAASASSSSSSSAAASGEDADASGAASGERAESSGEDAAPAPIFGGISASESAAPAAQAPAVSVVRDYGTAAVSDFATDRLAVDIRYPSGDCEAMTQAITDWISTASRHYGSEERGTPAHLTMDYCSYQVNRRVVSVALFGVISRSHDALPEPVAAAFTVDRASGLPLTLDDILPEGGQDVLLEKAAQQSGQGQQRSLLDTWMLTDEAVRLYLTDETGISAVDIPYADLEGYLAIPHPPQVALTFDDGPSANTDTILDLFQQYGGHGTFCVVGNRVEEYADQARRIVNEGSQIISHSWQHTQLTQLTSDEIRSDLSRTNEIIQSTTGVTPAALRPPYGSTDDSVKAVCVELGLYMVNWCIDTEDWRTKDAQAIADVILSEVQDGAIVLSHDLYVSTADAMKIVIPALIEQGYDLVTVGELLNDPQPGTLYRQAN